MANSGADLVLSLISISRLRKVKTLNSKPEKIYSENLWQTSVLFFCYQLIQKVWMVLYKHSLKFKISLNLILDLFYLQKGSLQLQPLWVRMYQGGMATNRSLKTPQSSRNGAWYSWLSYPGNLSLLLYMDLIKWRPSFWLL